jgi:hypothetical protein
MTLASPRDARACRITLLETLAVAEDRNEDFTADNVENCAFMIGPLFFSVSTRQLAGDC